MVISTNLKDMCGYCGHASVHDCNPISGKIHIFGRMKNEFSIVSYLEDSDSILNKHGIAFLAVDDMVHLGCKLPEACESKGVSVELCKLFEEGFFMKLFNIKSANHLDAITPRQLMLLYKAGIMNIACMIDDPQFGGELTFQKTQEGLFAIDEHRETRHLVPINLESFDDILSYTTKHFLMIHLDSKRQ